MTKENNSLALVAQKVVCPVVRGGVGREVVKADQALGGIPWSPLAVHLLDSLTHIPLAGEEPRAA